MNIWGRPTILHIDDDPSNIYLIKKILERAGYEVIGAISGETGVAVAENTTPDLILVDLYLPDVSGVDLAAYIKSMEQLAHIPVVMMTADASGFYERKSLEAGCDAYLGKPVSRNRLIRTIQSLVGAPQPAAAQA